MGDEAAVQPGTGQGQVANRVEQFVAGELVRHPQAGRIQHARLIDHDGVVQAAALGQSGGAQLVDFLGQREGAGARQFVAEASAVRRNDSA